MVAGTATTVGDRKGERVEDAKTSPRWRSTGWVPLAYPSSSFYRSSIPNPHFPLHRDVLLAATRELLILDGTINGKALEVTTKPVPFFAPSDPQVAGNIGNSNVEADPENSDNTRSTVMKPRYLRHLDPEAWKHNADEERTTEEVPVRGQDSKRTSCGGRKHRKRKHAPSSFVVASKKTKSMQNSSRNSHLGASGGGDEKMVNVAVTVEEDSSENDEDETKKRPSAEALADSIVKKALIGSIPQEAGDPVLSTADVKDRDLSSSKIERPLRKVSDADGEVPLSSQLYNANGAQVLLQPASSFGDSRDLSLFLNLSDRNPDGSYQLVRRDLPPLLEASIVSESMLREAAQKMTTNLTASFRDTALRLFLGYKSSAMKRDRLLKVLSEFLFDVSHAMFAWEETEHEILSELAIQSLSSPSQLDAAVRDALFDQRALAKIGGFDHSSLLPHAISISRLRKKNVIWKEFAKTSTGRRMLRHHRNGKFFAVGQKRRGQRLRPRTATRCPNASDEGRRSRSSSVTSYDGTESEGERTKASIPSVDVQPEPAKENAHLFDGMPDLTRLSITRKVGKSWGVLLSREGEHCLVVRAPEPPETEGENSGGAGLCCGDMILSVENERGEIVLPPSTSARLREKSQHDWFRNVVNLFMTSDKLHFLVRRVGSLSSSECLGN